MPLRLHKPRGRKNSLVIWHAVTGQLLSAGFCVWKEEEEEEEKGVEGGDIVD